MQKEKLFSDAIGENCYSNMKQTLVCENSKMFDQKATDIFYPIFRQKDTLGKFILIFQLIEHEVILKE